MSDFKSLLDHLQSDHRLIGVASVAAESQTAFMAIAMAEKLVTLGHSCLIVDLNNDNPELARLTGIMSATWNGQIDSIDDEIQALPNGLKVLIATHLVGAEYRTRNWIARLMDHCRAHADYTIVCMPAILEDSLLAAEPSTIAAAVDTVVLVTVARRDSQSQLVRAVDAIRGGRKGTRVAGIAINDFANPKLSEQLADTLQPLLARHPLFYRRLRNWLESTSILNVPY